MKKEKKKPNKLQVQVDLKKVDKYHFVSELSNVFFPYEPYPQQISVIKSIHKAIANKQNALIESPTGTGKTLCLLVGALSGVMGVDCKRKIYYLTRTHSQISQVISQFKRTVYNCNLNVIASREQLCINHNLSQLKGKNLQKACGQLCLQNLCTYRQFTHARIPKPLELQQFKEFCKKELACPYFYTKQLTQKCQITILPFNYLLDWNSFERNSIDLKDSVLIFDQAHNIDALCQQGSDIRLVFDNIYQAIGELKALIKAQSKKMLLKQFKQSNQQCQQVVQMKQQLQTFLNRLKSAEQVTYLTRNDLIQKIEDYTTTPEIQGLDLGNYSNFCLKGKRVVKLFNKKETASDNFQNFIETIEKIFFISNNQAEFKKFTIKITKGELYLRCLDPSLCFQRIVQAKPRTIILSSGTMGNLDVWQQNLQIPFEYKIANKSFINCNQLYAQVKTHSDRGMTFNFSFHGKQNQQQFQQVCRQLNNIEKIIKGGIVVAFSNYQLLEKTLKYCHLLEKKIYFETKGGNVEDIYKLYAQQTTKQGAFLFIIMKGRFSEGINFANQLCRCLIIVGIPFLPLKDLGVIEKMKFLQNNRSKAEAEQWYTQQSFKSLNQTLGRAIRNKDDYAVILLLDQRYQRNQNIKYLSKWFTSCLRPSENTYQHIQNFLKESPWKNKQIILPPQPSTKNKSQPTLCERLQQFSTPSKSNPKKLKLIIENDEKTSAANTISVKNVSLDLKQIKVVEQEETVYKPMNKELVNFFVKEQEEVTCQEGSQNTNQQYEDSQKIQNSKDCTQIKMFVSSRSFVKSKMLFDF